MLRSSLPHQLTFAKPVTKNYYAVIIRIVEKDLSLENFQETVSRCFTLIKKYNGDVNQFLGDIILSLWGVPLCFPTDKEKCNEFFIELKKCNLPVSAILLNDIGLYGSFGNETRLTVTAVSNKIFNAVKELINCSNRTFMEM